jgi:hypothetical protein
MAKVLRRSRAAVAPGSVYVGRPTKWGNPFVIGKDGTREEVIAKYREYALAKGLDKLAREELRGKNLSCWCAPLPCHADVLLEWANEPESAHG